jgi:hypothetical protein
MSPTYSKSTAPIQLDADEPEPDGKPTIEIKSDTHVWSVS